MLDFTLFFQPPNLTDVREGSLKDSVIFYPSSSEEIARNSICLFHVNEYRGNGQESLPVIDFRTSF